MAEAVCAGHMFDHLGPVMHKLGQKLKPPSSSGALHTHMSTFWAMLLSFFPYLNVSLQLKVAGLDQNSSSS